MLAMFLLYALQHTILQVEHHVIKLQKWEIYRMARVTAVVVSSAAVFLVLRLGLMSYNYNYDTDTPRYAGNGRV